MKVTVIGANSAFSVGEYKDAVPVDKLKELIPELSAQFNDKKTSTKELNQFLEAHIEKHQEKLYSQAWQSNFLIEFDQRNIRGDDSPFRLC